MKKPSQHDISRIIPNTVPFPNFYIDSGIWALLKTNEQSCIVILARKTYGWWKQSDRIAMSQMAKLTGMKEPTVRKVMSRLVLFGLAVCLSGDHDNGNPSGKEWALQVEDQRVDYGALQNRAFAKSKIDIDRTVGLKNTPTVPREPSPIVPHKATPTVARDPQNQSKPSNKKSAIPSKSKLIQEAFALHWKITLSLSWKSHLAFLKWAVDEAYITPAMIEYAKTTFDTDDELNWHGKRNTSLPFLQENWLKLIDGFGEVSQDYSQAPDMSGL